MQNQGDRLGINLNSDALSFLSLSWFLPLAILCSLLLLTWTTSGCSSASKNVKAARAAAREAYELQKPVVMQTSEEDERPEWTTKETFKEENGKLTYSGGVIGGADYVVTLRLAKAEATKNLLESIQIKVLSEFSTAIHGNNRNQNDVGQYVTDAVAWMVENLRLGGIKQREIYYEEAFNRMSQMVEYNVWVRLEISRADYVKAKTDAAQKLLDKAIREKDQEAKEKALELLERLRQEADTGMDNGFVLRSSI
jgi:hypothetical protein